MNKVFGITGSLGSGKSSLALQLQRQWPLDELNIIELDNIRRYVLWHSTENEHVQLRIKLSQHLLLNTETQYHWINREATTKIIFSSPENLSYYSLLATPYLKEEVKKEISKHPYTLLVWAYLIEESYLDLVTEQLILVNTAAELINKRLVNIDCDLTTRRILEPKYESRLNYLKQNSVSFIEYQNDKEMGKEQINNLIKQMVKNYE